MELYITEKDLERFWSRVDKRSDSEYWNFNSPFKLKKSKTSSIITIDGIQMPVYRFSYYLQYGDIPKDTLLYRICNNKRCVNPHHLQLVDMYGTRPIQPR